MTRAAIMRFQRRHHLTVDGVAGPQTRRALGRRGRPLLGKRALSSPQVGWDVAVSPVPPLAPRLLAGRDRRGVRPRHHARRHGLPALRGHRRRRGRGYRRRSARSRAAAPRRTPTPPCASTAPFPGPMGEGFGHVGGRRHTGIDFPAPSGTRIRGAGRGVVVFAGWNTGGYGNLVVVAHRLGFATWYAHMSRVSVRAGQAVSGGSILGRVGATGHATGPHVHFEVRRFEVPIDPDALSARGHGLPGRHRRHPRTRARMRARLRRRAPRRAGRRPRAHRPGPPRRLLRPG